MTTTLFAAGNLGVLDAAATWTTPRRLTIRAVAMSAWHQDSTSSLTYATWQLSRTSVYEELWGSLGPGAVKTSDQVMASAFFGPVGFVVPDAAVDFINTGCGFYFIPLEEKFRRGVELHLHANVNGQFSICHCTILWTPTH